jgi:hypothetical protein
MLRIYVNICKKEKAAESEVNNPSTWSPVHHYVQQQAAFLWSLAMKPRTVL